MSTPTVGHSLAELEEKLTTYWNLVKERETVEARIAKATTEKNSVNERIFRKVMADYETARDAVVSRLDPLKQELDMLRRSVEEDSRRVATAIQELEDQVAEVEFRHRVGEFDGARRDQALAALEPRVSEEHARRDVLTAQLEALDRRRTPAPQTAAPAQPEAPPTTAPAPSATESADVWDGLVETPGEWNQNTQPTTTAGVEENDPLAALSDPAPTREAASAPAPQAEPSGWARAAAVAPAYPSLVFRSGVNEGRIVPLLPMTMSIGREHDNNIELKDPEVARYHARIIYEEGRFVVEDLESSTGTWVNGQGQKRAPLTEGDVVRIGTTEMAFEFA